MPDEGDRALATLAVEAGYLSREEASQYWQRLLQPGSPRLAQLLLQDGRLTPAQMETLRNMFWSRQGAARNGSSAVATSLPQAGSPAASPAEQSRLTMLPDGAHT